MNRVIYIHGNQTTYWTYAWAPSLREQLHARGFETFFETMPDSIIARAEYWLPFLEEHVRAGANDILVGWSSGAVAAMRYAETHEIAGSVLIAPCYTDLNDELERMSGYYDEPWNWDAIRKHQREIHLITSATDPYIPQSEFDTIGTELSAIRTHLPSGGHFNEQSTFPEVLDAVLAIAKID